MSKMGLTIDPAGFHLTVTLSALKKVFVDVATGDAPLSVWTEYRLIVAGAPFFSPTNTATPSPSDPPPTQMPLSPSTRNREVGATLGASVAPLKRRISDPDCRIRYDSEGGKAGCLQR